MYCPSCLNDTLKIASSGVVKLTFDGKSKSTSLFYYNLKEDTKASLNKKLREKVAEYFEYYSNFQNQSQIKEIYIFSSDFKCSNSCAISLEQKFNVINLVILSQDFFDIVEEEADKYDIDIDLAKIKAANRA
tara:strand:+ start:72025 stop:72420 length:396 start_codon:yes stop_codon:yes gene_type:complete